MTRNLYRVCTTVPGDDDAMLAALDDSFGESHDMSVGVQKTGRGYLVPVVQWTAVPPLFNSYRPGQELCCAGHSDTNLFNQ